VREDLVRMRFEIPDAAVERFDALMAAIDTQMDALTRD
jgi:hypothetical protein